MNRHVPSSDYANGLMSIKRDEPYGAFFLVIIYTCTLRTLSDVQLGLDNNAMLGLDHENAKTFQQPVATDTGGQETSIRWRSTDLFPAIWFRHERIHT